MTSTIHGVLVGYDGSPDSQRALRWAAREARWRGTVLTVCHACAPGDVEARSGDGRASDHLQPAGDQNLAEALRFAQELMGSGQARPLLAVGPAAQVLCEHSADADMVVVGQRGRGGLPGSLLGSTGQQVCAHARGRVVVVRGHWHPAAGYVPGPVVVGADGSDGSRAAVAFAAEEATLPRFRCWPCALWRIAWQPRRSRPDTGGLRPGHRPLGEGVSRADHLAAGHLRPAAYRAAGRRVRMLSCSSSAAAAGVA